VRTRNGHLQQRVPSLANKLITVYVCVRGLFITCLCADSRLHLGFAVVSTTVESATPFKGLYLSVELGGAVSPGVNADPRSR
jgi:hypothetical protein